MLVDPLVLKKKLDRMATEQGAFAVLSSLLLYVTELADGDPQLSRKRTKWAEGKENKVSYNQPCPVPNRGQYPTRFQLLRSRFLNTNREPYTKKRREVGKLVIKERLWMSRAGNKLDRSRDGKGDGKSAEEDADTTANERARWSCASGKNTVKNILKKFLAAEEKEAKEKTPSWKTKGPNSGLPKIVNKSSVLSKLKEKFEQSTLCSAAEVKASLLHKGEKKNKSISSRRAIRKPEVRVLRTAAMTATGINSPESQYLVCSTVPVPRLSIATKINRPWSWSKNNATKQPLGHDTPLKEKEQSNIELGENKILADAEQDRKDKEKLPVAPETVSDAKNCAEANIDPTKQGPSFKPSTSPKTGALSDCTPPLSECSLYSDHNNIPAGPNISSLLGITNGVQHVKEDSPPSNLPYYNTTEGSHQQRLQDTKTGEIPEITMYLYSSEEADTELTEPEEDAYFAEQKCFSEQKAQENILPFHHSGVQASFEVEPPVEDRQLTHLTPASDKRPPTAQKEAPDLRGSCSEEFKEGGKYHSEDKIFSVSTKNGSDVSIKKEEENRTPNNQMQNESKIKQPQPQPPQMPTLQSNFDNSAADMSNPDGNQTKPTLSLNVSQEQMPVAAEENRSFHMEKTQSPLPDDLVKHSFYTAEEFGKDKFSSLNENMNHVNNHDLHRSALTDLETCHKPSKSFIDREEATADEMPWPDAEAWQSPTSILLPTPMSGIAEQRLHHTLGNQPALPPIDLVRQGDDDVGDNHASHGCEKHPPLSSEELTDWGNDTMVEKTTVCDFKNQVLSSNQTTENESSSAEEANTCQGFDNRLLLLTKEPENHTNTSLVRKPLLPLEKNRTPTSDNTTKQGSDMLEENLFPLPPKLVSDQDKPVEDRYNISKYTSNKESSSGDDMIHESDRMETGEREERKEMHRSGEEQLFTPSEMMDHESNSLSEKNAHGPHTPQLPLLEDDTSFQGANNSEQNVKHLTSSRDSVKHEHDMVADENTCCRNEKHQLSSSNEPVKHANESAEIKNIKSNVKIYSTPPRNTSRQENSPTDEESLPQNVKNEPVQHKMCCEAEENTLCNQENQTPLSDLWVTQNEMSLGDSMKPETKLAKKKTQHISEKHQSLSSNITLKPQERSLSGERKQNTPAGEDTRPPGTKTVREDKEYQQSGKYQLPPSRESTEGEENTLGGVETRYEDFVTPDVNAAKESNKFPSSKKYRSVSSEALVKPQEKNTSERKQETSDSPGFKKPDVGNVKEQDGDSNSKVLPSSKKVERFQEKNKSGDRKQKMPAAENIRSPETKVVKGDGKHQCPGNPQMPASSKSSKPETCTPEEDKTQTVPERFTKPDASDAKDKSKDPSFGTCQPPPSMLLMKPQEKNTTAKRRQSPQPLGEKTMSKTDNPEKKNGHERTEKRQLHSSAQAEERRNDGSGKEGYAGDLKSYQPPLPGDGANCESNIIPKEISLTNIEKFPKSSSFHVASKDEANPAGNRKKQPGFKKYQTFSSKNSVRCKNDAAEGQGACQAVGKTSVKKAELEDCSKAASLSKYTVESYSERPLDSTFKPLIIRVTDTFKHHS